ncbi:MAG: hypothetical protein ACLQPD_13530 [Desulfomonilaceae bacterium]
MKKAAVLLLAAMLILVCFNSAYAGKRGHSTFLSRFVGVRGVAA